MYMYLVAGLRDAIDLPCVALYADLYGIPGFDVKAVHTLCVCL